MDIKRSINTKVWNDPWFEELSSEEKLIWLYLLSNQYSNLLGIYEISIRRISYDTNTSPETIRKAFEGFGMVRKAFHINGYVVIINWLKNQTMNTNMKKCVESLLKDLPADLIKEIELRNFTLTVPNHLKASESNKLYGNGFNIFTDNLNHSEPLPNHYQTIAPIEIEKEIEKEIENEIEGLNQFDFFLNENGIFNKTNSEFLNSDMWFETKAMQLSSNVKQIRQLSKDFVIDLRDRDLLEGKDLTQLRSHFVSWFKKKSTTNVNSSVTYIPNLEDR